MFIKNNQTLKYNYIGRCIETGEEYKTAVIEPEDLFKYNYGANIQDAFPYLSEDDREFILSGLSPKGWEQRFGSLGQDEEKDPETVYYEKVATCSERFSGDGFEEDPDYD
jgi:hypothetical protein